MDPWALKAILDRPDRLAPVVTEVIRVSRERLVHQVLQVLMARKDPMV